jgi:glycosyltransferase involved in cell wall biosynthesis
MNVSVIVTVKNEGATIGGLLDSLCRQSRAPEEVIICDGGSTDDTIAIIETYQPQLPVKLISLPGSNISQGRNCAIKEAAGPIIVSTDAGVTLAVDWLRDLARPIEEDSVHAASGWFEPDPKSDFEVVMGATVLPTLSDIDPDQFLPSSRSVAFLKSAWERAGGYPEWLDFGEDIVFDLALRELYGPFPFVPTAVAYFRPRGDLASYSRQYYRYARGDGKANLWPGRHAIRYSTYLVALPFLLRLIGQGRLVGWALLLAGATVYCRRPAQRLLATTTNWKAVTRLLALVLIPFIRLVGDLAKMAGYPAGVYWRWRHR